MRGVRFPDRVRRLVLLEVLDGGSCRRVADRFGMSASSVWRIRHDAEVMSQLYSCSRARLGLGDREEISRGLAVGASFREIARWLDRPVSTVSREVNRNGGRDSYRATRAQTLTVRRACRPKPTVFERSPGLALVVETWLEQNQWSPEQISARLPAEFPDDETMRVSAETIYQALYVYGRGGLRKELTRHLRTQRSTRRERTVTARNRNAGPIADMVMIAERPGDVEDRLVPGHWEGDLIIGRNNGSQVMTLVERSTGLVLLGKLGNKRAETITACLTALIQTLPAQLRRSITWDQGSEMAGHREFTIATNIPVYFCDPHAPWQRGSNENTNGLLRQYLPRDRDLSRFSQDQLDDIAAKLNNRPRKRHDFQTPLEVFDHIVLH